MATKTINELTLKLNADVAELKADLAGAKTQLSGFKKGVESIGASIKNAFAVGAIIAVGKQLFDFGKELSTIGGQLAGTKMNFDKLNDPNLLKELRAATGGTVSDLELMKAALNADDMRVPLDKLSGFFRYARNEVQETGGSVTELVDTLITGLGKNSTKSLAQLGISTKEYKEELAKTGDMMSAVSNIMNRKLKESGQYVETAADITARWGATWENIKGGIGLLINQALVKIAPILDEIGAWFVKIWKVSSQWIIDTYNGFVDLYNESMIFRAIIATIEMGFKNLWETIKVIFRLVIDSVKIVGKSLAFAFNPSNWGEGFTEGLQKIIKESGAEVFNDVKTFGNNVATNYMDGMRDVFEGKAKKISTLIPDWLDNEEVKKKSKDKGDKLGKEIARNIGEGIESIDISPAKSVDLGKTFDINKIKVNIAEFKASMQNMGKVAVETTELVQNALAEGFSAIGEGIGDLMSGGGLQGIFKNFLNLLSNFMSAFGKVLISIGVAKMALDKIFVNPAAAIVAGITLIALSKIASNMMAKQKFAGGGIVGGYSFGGDRVPVLANSGEMILNSAQQGNLFKMLKNGNSGAGGELVARVSGNDLVFILEQTKRKQNLLY